MLKRILVPVKFGNNTSRVIAYATKWASKFGAELHIINIYHDFFDTSSPVVLKPSMTHEEVIREQLDELETSIKSTPSGTSIPVKSDYKFGFTIQEIINASKEHDMIIMSSSGKDKFLLPVFDPISNQVASKAHCPVLLVPAEGDTPQLPKNILFAANYVSVKSAALIKVRECGIQLGAKLHLVHVDDGNDNIEDVAIFERAMSFKGSYPEVTFTIENENNVVNGLLDYIDSEPVDLTVLVTHRRNFWTAIFDKGISRNLARATDIPMLIFRFQDDVDNAT